MKTLRKITALVCVLLFVLQATGSSVYWHFCCSHLVEVQFDSDAKDTGCCSQQFAQASLKSLESYYSPTCCSERSFQLTFPEALTARKLGVGLPLIKFQAGPIPTFISEEHQSAENTFSRVQSEPDRWQIPLYIRFSNLKIPLA